MRRAGWLRRSWSQLHQTLESIRCFEPQSGQSRTQPWRNWNVCHSAIAQSRRGQDRVPGRQPRVRSRSAGYRVPPQSAAGQLWVRPLAWSCGPRSSTHRRHTSRAAPPPVPGQAGEVEAERGYRPGVVEARAAPDIWGDPSLVRLVRLSRCLAARLHIELWPCGLRPYRPRLSDRCWSLRCVARGSHTRSAGMRRPRRDWIQLELSHPWQQWRASRSSGRRELCGLRSGCRCKRSSHYLCRRAFPAWRPYSYPCRRPARWERRRSLLCLRSGAAARCGPWYRRWSRHR